MNVKEPQSQSRVASPKSYVGKTSAMSVAKKLTKFWIPRSTGTKKLPPNAEGTRDAFARIGYSLEEAIGDLVDNSLDASADEVVIRFITVDEIVSRIIIADSGHGMTERNR